jgi:hypothetical protein
MMRVALLAVMIAGTMARPAAADDYYREDLRISMAFAGSW